MIAISTRPPIHSAAVNCQPISSHRMMPSSITRFVDENRNARLGTSAAPFLKSVLLIAAAAYEHDELAAPKPVASAISRTPSRPSSALHPFLRHERLHGPDSAKPSTRLQTDLPRHARSHERSIEQLRENHAMKYVVTRL